MQTCRGPIRGCGTTTNDNEPARALFGIVRNEKVFFMVHRAACPRGADKNKITHNNNINNNSNNNGNQ